MKKLIAFVLAWILTVVIVVYNANRTSQDLLLGTMEKASSPVETSKTTIYISELTLQSSLVQKVVSELNVQIKDGVIISGLDIRMRDVLIKADSVWKTYGEELVVTSGLDGVHSAGSLHYYGLALDFRTRYFTAQIRAKVADDLQAELGENFLVINEKNHIHVQYQLS